MKDKLKTIWNLVQNGAKTIWSRIVAGCKNAWSRFVEDTKGFVADIKSIKSVKDLVILKKYVYKVLIVFFALVFLVSATFVVRYMIQSYQHKKYQDYLQSLHTQPSRPNTVPLRPSTSDNFTYGDITWPWGSGGEDTTDPHERPTDPNATGESGILLELEALYKLNKDVVGYLYIPGTNVNYPVLHRPSQKDYYLYKDILGRDDNHGSLYVREACNVFSPSDNVTIYGHNMADATMFAHLFRFKDETFFNEHPIVYFDNLYERHTYQVLCLFRTSGTYGVGFPYHLYDDFEDEAEFNEFVKKIRKLAIHDSGISVSYGDKFICLSTCEDWPIKNGRLVLVAVRID